MKFIFVDQIIDSIVILESLEDCSILHVPLSNFSFPVREGDVVFKDTTYHLDLDYTRDRLHHIQQKLNLAKKKDY